MHARRVQISRFLVFLVNTQNPVEFFACDLVPPPNNGIADASPPTEPTPDMLIVTAATSRAERDVFFIRACGRLYVRLKI